MEPGNNKESPIAKEGTNEEFSQCNINALQYTGSSNRDDYNVNNHGTNASTYQHGYFPSDRDRNGPNDSISKREDNNSHKISEASKCPYKSGPETVGPVDQSKFAHCGDKSCCNAKEKINTGQQTTQTKNVANLQLSTSGSSNTNAHTNRNLHLTSNDSNLPGPDLNKEPTTNNEVRPSYSKALGSNKKNDSQPRDMSARDCKILPELPRVQISSPKHHVLYSPASLGTNLPPKPYPENCTDGDNKKGFVKMPHSNKIKQHDDKHLYQTRWSIIQEALKKSSINTSEELHNAIASYNHPHGSEWKFSLLKNFLKEDFARKERNQFFKFLLPKIIELALRLPELVTQPIPLLKANEEMSISLSQLQIASLLANAFLCTFPHRNAASLTSANDEFCNYPSINFDTLFNVYIRGKARESIFAKLRCLVNYFNRVTSKEPTGVLTFTRRYITYPSLDQNISAFTGNALSHVQIIDDGVIEDCRSFALQADFANKVIGGGVLGRGCVQEEIRFVACPELIVSRLFTETLNDNEALVIAGVEQYNSYAGYSDTFQWLGDYQDDTPHDDSGRRQCCLLAMDARPFLQTEDQYHLKHVDRELCKAFVAFYNPDVGPELRPVATGNWGCGIFGGDPILKFVIQVAAATLTKRNMKYYVPGDKKLKRDLEEIYKHLAKKNATAGKILNALQTFNLFKTGERPHSSSKQSKSAFEKYLFNHI